jgi:TolB protein
VKRLLVQSALLIVTATAGASELIGYTELQTNLPGGRHANVRTMRAMVVNADGSGRRALADGLANEHDAWTQFAGWSPDGKQAIILRGWESPENARWEEDHKTFRFTNEGWLVDTFLLDLATGELTNVTAVDRVSFYNSALFFWPHDSSKLGFTALVDGNSHPFRMNIDGRDKVDLTSESKEFAYGFSSSPDGRRIAYHKSYQVFLADADGSHAVQVQTGQPFNFVPTWSPDGKWVLFLSGEHYHCHPHVVRADGSGLRKLADRGGYRGVVAFLDVPDFHGGSSDTPVWSADGHSIFHTAQVGPNVELFQTWLDGRSERLTRSPTGTLNYHPQPSADGRSLAFGSRRDGIRQLFIMNLNDHSLHPLTNLPRGRAAMWPSWQPAAPAKIPVILDTDIGGDIDDTWALALLLRSPEFDVKLVVSDTGDTEYRSKIIARMLEVAHRTEIPVGVGIRQSTRGGPQAAWVAGYDLARYPGKVYRDGVDAILKTIKESPVPITLICIGAMPNIKAALERSPEITRRVRFVGMHGSVRLGYGGKPRPDPEANVISDVPAAKAVFTASWPMTITPLDTCGLVHLAGENYRKVAASANPLARAVIENYEIWRRAGDPKVKQPATASSVLFDTVAIHLGRSQEWLRMEDLPLVITDDGFTRVDSKGKKVACAMSWTDQAAFERMLVERLTGGR